MPVDPGPFLSTVVLASAGLVAIVGGLLVARFVGLDSDQQSSRNVLADAEQRLATAERRAADASQRLTSWHAKDFIGERDVRAAIGQGTTALPDLRRLASCELTDDELATVVAEVAAEFKSVRDFLASPGMARRIEAAEYKWVAFRRESLDLPDIRWPQVWRDVFEDVAKAQKREDDERHREEYRRTHPLALPDLSYLGSRVPPIPPRTDHVAISARRYDEVRADYRLAQQRVEDYDDELRRLRQAHAQIVRPDSRLWWGVGILVAFAIVGVGLPAGLMAFGPPDLSRVRWVFYPFTAGLLALLAYIVFYLVQITRRK